MADRAATLPAATAPGAVDNPRDSPYTARTRVVGKALPVGIKNGCGHDPGSDCPDPLEFHRVVPAKGTNAVLVFCGRARHKNCECPRKSR